MASTPIESDVDVCCDPYEEGCTASLNDGEGWNGACGNCADRQYADEEGGWWLDDTAEAAPGDHGRQR
jgi:hypothetical protein